MIVISDREAGGWPCREACRKVSGRENRHYCIGRTVAIGLRDSGSIPNNGKSNGRNHGK